MKLGVALGDKLQELWRAERRSRGAGRGRRVFENRESFIVGAQDRRARFYIECGRKLVHVRFFAQEFVVEISPGVCEDGELLSAAVLGRGLCGGKSEELCGEHDARLLLHFSVARLAGHAIRVFLFGVHFLLGVDHICLIRLTAQ